MVQYIKNKMAGVYGIWFITLLLLNVSQISAYYHTGINKFILSFCVMGFLYCIRNGVFKKENRTAFMLTSVVTIGIGIYFIKTNVFDIYIYYNYTLSLALIIFANLYVVLIRRYREERTFPSINKLTMVVFALFLSVWSSISGTKEEVFFIVFLIIPIFLEKHTKEEKVQVIKGMIDGTCIGFLVAQAYAFGFQHYTFARYHGYCMNTTYGGLMYMYTYNAFLAKYVIAKIEKHAVWKTRLYWWISAFVLSLLYLTGGRSPVLGIMCITAIFFLALQWFMNKRIKFIQWMIKCVTIGCVSLMLFPVAYASVRYLPTIINRPDYIDSLGNRYYSPMLSLGQTYCYDNLFVVGSDGLLVDPTYIPFEQSLYECVGRIIPGGTTIIAKAYDVLGITYVEELEENLAKAKVNVEEQPKEMKRIEEAVPTQSEGFMPLSTRNTNAVNMIEVDGTKLKGSSADDPWFMADDELTSFGIRYSIHRYAISKLNIRGHESSNLNFHMVEGEGAQPHAHNIFLIYGYNFGIPAMLCLFAMILVLNYKYIYCLVKEQEMYALFGTGIVLTTLIFGMFEYSFAVTMYITYVIYLLPFLIPTREV